MDEFANPDLVFDMKEDFENHMLTMARSFILGIPLNSDVDDIDDDPIESPSKNTLKPKDIQPPKIKPIKTNIKTFDLSKESSDVEEANSSGSSSEEDSDDDDWL